VSPVGAGLVLAALGLGAAVGLFAVLVHREGGPTVPWGVVLACAASAAGSIGLRALGAGPGVLVGYGAGWCALVLTVLYGRPEGDYLLGGDARGWVFLTVGAGSVVVATIIGAGGRRLTPP